MTLRILRSTVHAFATVFFSCDFYFNCLMIRLVLMVFGRKTMEARR
jgi:hypothetical protein